MIYLYCKIFCPHAEIPIAWIPIESAFQPAKIHQTLNIKCEHTLRKNALL